MPRHNHVPYHEKLVAVKLKTHNRRVCQEEIRAGGHPVCHLASVPTHGDTDDHTISDAASVEAPVSDRPKTQSFQALTLTARITVMFASETHLSREAARTYRCSCRAPGGLNSIAPTRIGKSCFRVLIRRCLDHTRRPVGLTSMVHQQTQEMPRKSASDA